MKKTICKVISVVMIAVCIFAFALCVKVFIEPTHGFFRFQYTCLCDLWWCGCGECDNRIHHWQDRVVKEVRQFQFDKGA